MGGELKDKKVKNFTGIYSDVVTIKSSKTVINAFNMMVNQDITGVAVVNNKIRRDYPIAAPRSHYSTKHVPFSPIFVTPEQTFLDVLRLMDDGNIHRVYVCSEGSVMRGKPRPIHVITQTDMLEAVLNQYTSLG